MSRVTDDPNDPRLSRGIDDEPQAQNEVYLVLSEEERAKGFVRPLRTAYVHVRGERACHSVTTMGLALSETYARDPKFYGATYCVRCSMHLPVADFDWDGTTDAVGS